MTHGTMTVGIVSYQRRPLLASLLTSLADCLGPLDRGTIDVLVVLDGSDDGSSEAIEAMSATFPVELSYHWQPNGGPAAARNACLDRATGERIWMLDDDMLVTRKALDAHYSHPLDDGDVLMGPCNIATSARPLQAAARRWYEAQHERLAAQRFVTDSTDCSFANASAQTALLRDNLFDDRFRGYGFEDYELALRLLQQGSTFVFDLQAGVEHHYDDSREVRLAKMRQEGRNRMHYVTVHPSELNSVFGPDVGRLERIVRPVARRYLARPIWWLALSADRLAGDEPARGARLKLFDAAQTLAVYAGAAEARRGSP